MKIKPKKLAATLVGIAVFTLAGCGGGGGGVTSANTTTVPINVIDGAIQNATVCLDKNSNGVCDTGEPFAKSDSAGKVNLVVDNADVGKYPVLAVVGTDAIDADTGAVPTPYTMSAPADQAAVITPLTTLVQDVVASTGVTSAAAETQVKAQTGINISLFQDFTKGTTADHLAAATVARMVVVTTQRQVAAIGSVVVGTQAADGAVITQADINKAVRTKLLELLPDLLTALSDPAVQAAATPAAKEAALLAAANTLMNTSGLTAASMPTVVAINTQASSIAPVAAATPSAGFKLTNLNFTDVSNFYLRVFGSSLAQATPDASGNTKYAERRYNSSAGTVAQWGTGKEPRRQADLHWNNTAWVSCPINFENTSSARDAAGNNSYNYCDNFETGTGKSAKFDVSGKTMASVISDVRAAGYTNLSIGDNSSAALSAYLGTATFPAGSSVIYSTGMPLKTAVAFYPSSSNWVTQYSAAVSAGGLASSQTSGTACKSTEYQSTNGTASTTLESMMAAMTGTPCDFTSTSPASFVYNTITYTNPDAKDEAWGNSTLSIGTIGTAPVNSGTSAPGYYSGNTRLRVAFKGTGANPVTYYACKERFNGGSSRNCSVIGAGSYTIATLGDARALTLNNLPAQAAPMTYTQVFVERAGHIYWGYQNKPNASSSARLNTAGATALLTQLGVASAVPDPSVPMVTLTAASYAGNYSGTFSGTSSGFFYTSINAAGTTTCSGSDATVGAFACSFGVSPATATTANVTLGVASTGASFSGTVNFDSGVISGSWINGGGSGAFAGMRQ